MTAIVCSYGLLGHAEYAAGPEPRKRMLGAGMGRAELALPFTKRKRKKIETRGSASLRFYALRNLLIRMKWTRMTRGAAFSSRSVHFPAEPGFS